MPNAIVMNTLTGAVSEYSNFDFHAITATHGGSALGLYLLGGDLDLTAKVVAEVATGRLLWNTSAKKYLDHVYFSIEGSGVSTMRVYGEVTYSYTFPVRAGGESRAVPGRGIRENYLAFGYSNTDGSNFVLDRIEVGVSASTNRRV
jgi:hypothetical protein